MSSVLQNLILDCGIYMLSDQGQQNYVQISGLHISNLIPSSVENGDPNHASRTKSRASPSQRPNEIVFVRSRMLYARPSLGHRGQVRFGLKHVHVLNRYPNASDPSHTAQIMECLFPRQFGLHNVFTTKVNARQTAHAFNDYTMREAGIRSKTTDSVIPAQPAAIKIPRRLRGTVITLIRKLQRNHRRCAYTQLLRHYCGIKRIGLDRINYDTTSSPERFATCAADVSAFCRAVFRRLITSAMMGNDEAGAQNQAKLLNNIDTFVHLRRAESMTLHQAMQGIKVIGIAWLAADRNQASYLPLAKSDYHKRVEILQEFIYYVFDSIWIPLICSHFYVTESAPHGNKLHYFRHDVWRRISEPSLGAIKARSFEALAPERSRKLLQNQSVGYGQLRLVPKSQGMRPIINLSRCPPVMTKGQKVQSVNKQLQPVLNALRFEKNRQPDLFGSAMFSVSAINRRLTDFSSQLDVNGSKRLYFVKMDIKSCFDTIPHGKLLAALGPLLPRAEYSTRKRAQISLRRVSERHLKGGVMVKWPDHTDAIDAFGAIETNPEKQVSHFQRNTVVAETGSVTKTTSDQLLGILHAHVKNSLVKVGKRYFRQCVGIPQGSALSSLLCSYFYTAFENDCLSFLKGTPTCLLRLIDDFLLITTEKGLAIEFLTTMQTGSAVYGICVNPEKSLINFDAGVRHSLIPRTKSSTWFPYCGLNINMQNLMLSRNWDRKDPSVRNNFRVEKHRTPGHTLTRRVLLFLKVRLATVVTDVERHTRRQVIMNTFEALMETAMKFHLYSSILHRKRERGENLQATITAAVEFVKQKVKTVQCSSGQQDSGQTVDSSIVCWLVATAFVNVLRRKQSTYAELLGWLEELQMQHSGFVALERALLQPLLRKSTMAFLQHRF